MREVYESRATWVEHQKRLIDAKKRGVLQEKQDIDSQANIQRQQAEEDKLKGRIISAKHSEDILMQVAEKDKVRRRGYQEEMYEQRAQKLAELDYTRKVNTEWEKNQEALKAFKKLR